MNKWDVRKRSFEIGLDIWSKLTNENCNFELTYEQFRLIRSWIRENEAHGHNFALPVFNSIAEAKSWVKMVILADYNKGYVFEYWQTLDGIDAEL